MKTTNTVNALELFKMSKEAKARIKINQLLAEAGWHLLDTLNESANVILEGNVKITQKKQNELGEDFETTKNGFMDYLLLDKKGFPIAVLEAKSELKDPLDGKEQARTYALSVGRGCRFIILSNGNHHYLWDLLIGNPKQIHTFPTLEALKANDQFQPNHYSLVHENVDKDFIARTQRFDVTNAKDPRELERRMMLDTYAIFGCENGIPTFSYTLLDGVKDGYLINPIVVDARTDITTQLLSEEGYSVLLKTDEELEMLEVIARDEPTEGDAEEDAAVKELTYRTRDFERKFFSERTNRIFCETFLQNALRDPISGEIGKTIIFCVSQKHAARIAQLLNELAHDIFKGKYQSDFAVQVTSNVTSAQQFTIDFTNNRLLGSANFHPQYKTSKARVCVTVGMMTTGYDCPDVLNLCFMRPIFSPTDFVQIKGRGTRKHDFTDKLILLDSELGEQLGKPQKTKYKLFDFFANCEYFEETFNYDEIIPLPAVHREKKEGTNTANTEGGSNDIFNEDEASYESRRTDWIVQMSQNQIGIEGMKIDRKLFDKYEEVVASDDILRQLVNSGNQKAAEDYVLAHIFDKPNDYINLDGLRKAIRADRRITIWETLLKAFGLIPYIKTQEELLNDAFEKFDSRYLPPPEHFQNAKNFFKSYLTDADIKEIIDNKQFAYLNTNPNGDVYRKLPPDLRRLIPEYIKDYVLPNPFES